MKTKFKQGEYICKAETVMLHIEAVVEGDIPIYAVSSVKTEEIRWDSEYELENYSVTKPDFKKWEGVRSGDLIHCGTTDDRTYCKVLARVGDMVLISLSPLSGAERQKIDSITSQLEELTEGAITQEELKERGVLPKSSTAAYRTANRWWSVRQLALMNWELMTE